MTRAFRFTKFGIAEDPRNRHIVWTIGDRKYLAEVTDVYRNEQHGVTMLRTRYFNGETAPEVSASIVEVIG